MTAKIKGHALIVDGAVDGGLQHVGVAVVVLAEAVVPGEPVGGLPA